MSTYFEHNARAANPATTVELEVLELDLPAVAVVEEDAMSDTQRIRLEKMAEEWSTRG